MTVDDVMYVLSLLACIGAGKYILKISDELQRKYLSTAFGIILVIIVSGFQSMHCFFSATVGALAIIFVPVQICHLVTFGIMFGYLILFRLSYVFGYREPTGHTNMIQMVLTLKVAGLAFEKTAAWKKIQQRKAQEKKDLSIIDESIVVVTDYDKELQSIGFTEIMHYSFNYIGVLIGPYYRYRTFRDYFDTPFKNYAPKVETTIEKLKYAGLYCVLYLVVNHVWPLEYALSDEFYEKRSFFYRLMYVWPTFFVFRMRMYTGLTLSECVCTMAGFGAYPDDVDVVNGEGPKKPYSHLKPSAEKLSYNFTTIVNTRVKDVETCWTFREGMKHWNICVQYWLAVNVYKLFPSKKYRTAVTLLCSAYWHGFRPGHYFCLMGAPFYVPLEDIWNKLVRLDATGTKRQIINVIFWIAKFFTFSYLGTAFLLVSFSNIWKFYSSVYHIGYICWAVMIALGIFLTKQKKALQRRQNRNEDSSTPKSKVQ